MLVKYFSLSDLFVFLFNQIHVTLFDFNKINMILLF